MNLESRLRQALRPVEPPRDLVDAVLSRLAPTDPAAATAITPHRRSLLPLALAASLVVALAAGIAVQLEQSREAQRAAQAHAQLVVALQITSARLETMHRYFEASEENRP